MGNPKSNTVPRWKILEFPFFSDERGETVPFELDNRFPFPVKRVYIITGTSEETRGGHAHTCEEEVFVAVSGSVTAVLHDGKREQEVVLNEKNKGLYVSALCWHEFKNFSSDAVMLCFSSTHFAGRGEYIENKKKFIADTAPCRL